MALQIRLVHALADEVIELPPHSVEQPLVVGRSDKAEVHIPSANVGLRHCLLFVHGGRWIVQDGGSPGGTLLNGAPLTTPTRLNSGDVITLAGEANPAMLVVDPNNTGVPVESAAAAASPVRAEPEHSGALAGMGVAPVAPPVVRRPDFPVAPPLVHAMPAASVYAADLSQEAADPNAEAFDQEPPQYAEEPHPADTTHMDETLEAPSIYLQAAPTVSDLVNATTLPRRKPAKQKGLSAMVIVMTAIAALIIIVVGISIVKSKLASNAREEARAKAEADKLKAERNAADAILPPVKGPKTVFNFEKDPVPPRRPPVAPPVVAENNNSNNNGSTTPSARQMATTGPAPADDPRRQTDQWLRVENACLDPDPVHAIVIFDDYLKEYPDTPFKADLLNYTDQAMNRLWFNRIVELCKRRSQARTDIGSLQKQIQEETDAAYKKTLLGSKADAEKKLADATAELKDDFKYTGNDVPSVDDPVVSKSLIANRDAKEFEKWKKMVYRRIVSSHGTKLPWS